MFSFIKSNGLQRRSHGWGQNVQYSAIDYDYIKFTFSGCGVYDSEEALYHEQLCYEQDVSRECEQISGS